MDLWQERHDRLVKQAFGHAARLAGSIGTADHPGRLEIVVGNRTLGSGSTFGQALADVTTRATAVDGRHVR